jgi:hypothetical protein
MHAIDSSPAAVAETAAAAAAIDSYVRATRPDLPADPRHRDRTAGVVSDPTADPFDDLARRAFALQCATVPEHRRLAEAQGVSADSWTSWESVPLVPVSAFRRFALHVAPARETFRSSGTTGGEEARSVHHHPFPDLYRTTIDAAFPAAIFAGLGKPDALSIVVPRSQSTESSLGFMIDHVLARHAGPGSLEALGPRGVEAAKVRSWLGAHQRGHVPVAVLATGFALVELLDALERLGVRFRLPAGSVVFETGGLKGKAREVSRAELLDRVETWLGVPRQRVAREYGMTELTSQFYTAALAGGDPDVFLPSPWTRVHLLDPETLAPVAAGHEGLIAVFDLANVGSALHVLTEDLGVAEGAGFRLVGRLAGAAPRGCSLAIEEMLRG